MTADERARETEAQMTDEERFSLLVSVMGTNDVVVDRDERIPEGVPMSAGYVPGVERLGVPALLMSDASLGVTNPGYRPGDTATALPAGIALGASFNPALARSSGAMVGREARSRGLNVMLAGGVNLARDPRNGRNFEYLSEDPLLSGVLAGEAIAGIQGEGVISTIKHFSLNCNETNRHWLDALIDPAAHRESDLLAFEIAIERGQPGSVMTAYNKVNGVYAGANRVLIEEILKGAWGYPGWVMSDWGATPTLGLRAGGPRPGVGRADRRDDVGRRVLHRAAARGVRRGRAAARSACRRWCGASCARCTRSASIGGRPGARRRRTTRRRTTRSRWRARARASCCSRTTASCRSRADTTARIAVIGGYADLGVPVGTGSSAVMPPGGYAAEVHIGGPGIMGSVRNLYLLPSSPMQELGRLMPEAEIEFDPGMTPAEAALLAGRSDVAIVFAIRVEGEGFDLPDLSLPWGQDAVIDAVASANPNTIVVLETGNPVAMPWREKVRAIVQAWYPGQAGGQAIAEVLTGAVNPSGRLPVSFPADLGQTPRPELPGLGTPWGTPDDHRLRRGRRGRLPLVRAAGDGAALRLRPRPGLHELRVRRARGRARARPSPRASRSPTRASATAPTCPSST